MSRYHITLNHIGYILAEKEDSLQYKRKEIPPFGSNSSSGQKSMLDLLIWDAWQQSTFNHGFGIHASEDDDAGYLDTGDRVDTRFPQGVTLFPSSTAVASLNVAVNCFADNPADATVVAGAAADEANGCLWLYDTALGTWSQFSGATRPQDLIYDMVTHDTYTVFSYDHNDPVMFYDGSTCQAVKAATGLASHARYLAVGIINGDVNTYVFHTTNSSAVYSLAMDAWPSSNSFAHVHLPSEQAPTGIAISDGYLYVAQPAGLFKGSWSGGVLTFTQALNWSANSSTGNGKRMLAWQDLLYLQVNNRLYSYDGSNLVDVSPPDLGSVWPYEPYSDFSLLSSSGAYLLVAAKANASTVRYDLLAYDGSYWHKLAELVSSTTTLNAFYFSMLTSKLWYQSSTPATNYIPWRSTSDFPDADFPVTGNHYLTTSRITAGLEDIDKALTSITVWSSLCTATQTIAVEYRVDGNAWTSAGTINTSPRQELAVTYAASGAADAGSSTTALVDAARTEATTDHWKNAYVHMTSGLNKGLTRRCSAFNATTDTLTVAAFPSAIATGDTYEIWWYGKRFELRFDLQTTSATLTPVLEAVSMKLRARPPVSLVWELGIKCAARTIYVDGAGYDARSAAQIRADLTAARESVQPVALVDIDGTAYSVHVSELVESDVANPRPGGIESVITLELQEAA